MESIGPALNFMNINLKNSLSRISFEGIFNENYFEISSKESNLILNLEISKAKIKNPITSEIENFIGLMIKSKYDGENINESIDLSIALDNSSSMNYQIEVNKVTQNSRINLSKDALSKLILTLRDSDNLSLITFNDTTNIIFPLSTKKECINNLNLIKEIKAKGGKNILIGLEAAIQNISKSKKNNKRIIIITDMLDEYCDNMNKNEKLKELFKKSVNELKIPITIIAISGDSNTSLAYDLCKEQGCNFFTVFKDEDLDYFIMNNFRYFTFPNAYNLQIELEYKNLEIEECIGTGFKRDKFYINQNAPPINFNENSIIKSKIIFEETSSFPSDLNISNSNLYQKGGLILIKFKNYNEEKQSVNIRLNYLNREEEKISQNYCFEIDNIKGFSSNTIETGISLYYFTDLIKEVFEKEKNNLLDEFNFSDILKIKEFLISHYKTYDEKGKNKKKYLDLFDEIYTNK